jgi:hypothetical protein
VQSWSAIIYIPGYIMMNEMIMGQMESRMKTLPVWIILLKIMVMPLSGCRWFICEVISNILAA